MRLTVSKCLGYLRTDLLLKGGDLNRPVHVINVEIKDNHEEALIAGRALLDLCNAVRSTFFASSFSAYSARI